jgi:hypothetical protein
VAPICGCGCGRREFLQVQCDASFMKGMCPRSVTNECQNSWRICVQCKEKLSISKRSKLKKLSDFKINNSFMIFGLSLQTACQIN